MGKEHTESAFRSEFVKLLQNIILQSMLRMRTLVFLYPQIVCYREDTRDSVKCLHKRWVL